MDVRTARRLTELTQAFYAEVAPSFSATRQTPWRGWELAWQLLDLPCDRPLLVRDVACGNLRFERFLSEQGISATVVAQDSCPALVDLTGLTSTIDVHYEQVDLVKGLSGSVAHGDGPREDAAGEGPFDLSVCFGFMHHLPLEEQRSKLLKALVECLTPQGFAVISFWQFADDERLRTKAEATTKRAREQLELSGLGPHDYVLGWQERDDVLRFCHHATEDEIDRLVRGVNPEAEEVARFSADGKSGALNRYVVFRAHAA